MLLTLNRIEWFRAPFASLVTSGYLCCAAANAARDLGIATLQVIQWISAVECFGNVIRLNDHPFDGSWKDMSHVTRFGNGTREENCSSDRFSFKNCPLHINYSTVLNGSLVFVSLCQRNMRYAVMKSALALPIALPAKQGKGDQRGSFFGKHVSNEGCMWQLSAQMA